MNAYAGFILIGVALLSSPYWLRRRAKHTYYVLTDRRAITWEARSFGQTEIRSYGPEDLAEMFRVEYAGGGDLVFEERLLKSAYQQRPNSASSYIERYGFLGIENVNEVEELLRRTLLTNAE